MDGISDEFRIMLERVDTASQLIRASAATIYQAFATAGAMKAWLPPQGMTATMFSFAFREGGAYRMRLTYNEPQHMPGKTSEDTDDVEVRIVKIRSEEHTSELQSLMRISYAVFCLKKQNKQNTN